MDKEIAEKIKKKLDTEHTSSNVLFAWLKPCRKRVKYIDFTIADEPQFCSIDDINKKIRTQHCRPEFLSRACLYVESNFPVLIDFEDETISLIKSGKLDPISFAKTPYKENKLDDLHKRMTSFYKRVRPFIKPVN